MPYSNCYFQNDIVPYENARLHISDLGIQRGYGIFDFFSIVNGAILWKNDYFNRFYNSAKLAALDVPIERKQLEETILELTQINNAPNSNIKLILTGGLSSNGYTYEAKPTFCIIQYEKMQLPMSAYENGMTLLLHEYERSTPLIKSLNYFTSVSLYKDMKAHSAIDVLYHKHGIVSECSRSNIFIVKNGHIITNSAGILLGITRKNLLKSVDGIIPIIIKEITLDDIWAADEIFISSTTKYALPITQIQDQKINNGWVGNVSKRVIEIFNSHYIK